MPHNYVIWNDTIGDDEVMIVCTDHATDYTAALEEENIETHVVRDDLDACLVTLRNLGRTWGLSRMKMNVSIHHDEQGDKAHALYHALKTYNYRNVTLLGGAAL